MSSELRLLFVQYRISGVEDQRLDSPQEIWEEHRNAVIGSNTKEQAREVIGPILMEISLYERDYLWLDPPLSDRDAFLVTPVTETLEEIIIRKVPQQTPLSEEEVRKEIHDKTVSLARSMPGGENADMSKITKIRK